MNRDLTLGQIVYFVFGCFFGASTLGWFVLALASTAEEGSDAIDLVEWGSDD